MKHELADGWQKDLVGYCDPLSVAPGQKIAFMLSGYAAAVGHKPTAQIVRLSSGDDRPHGTGMIESPVATLAADPLKHQPLRLGSYGLVNNFQATNADEIGLKFLPTLLSEQQQTLMRWGAFSIALNQSGICCRGSEGELWLSVNLLERRWYELKLTLGDEVVLSLVQIPLGVAEARQTKTATTDRLGGFAVADLYFACHAPSEGHFNGCLENPYLLAGGIPCAQWDFSQQVSSQKIVDVSGHEHDGVLLQTPTRAVKSSAWDGSTQNFRQKPEHYAAIHFHEDDLTDAGWEVSLAWSIPQDLDSGIYALKVTLDGSEDYTPFFVRAKPGKRKPLALLIPTASYLAYANQRLGFTEGPFGKPRLRDANSAFLSAHEDVGFSMYEYHRDGSGVHFSSRLRPIINMKPKNPTWAFGADTHITAWLDATDQAFDVLTDEDLHRHGSDALSGYRAVITGTHPEYYSTQMRDGLEGWLGRGGRLMYMGGNGFYWRVAFQPDNPAIMEVRRAEDGTRAWIAEPGEYYHQFNGEYGGLWRRLGKPPNQLVGIGFAAQGFDGGTYYRRKPGALDARVEFIMAGVSDSEAVGNYGNQGGGAAGEEIDRWDPDLGSPKHAVVIASSENHRPGMLRVKEEYHMMQDRHADPKVRADMVFFELPGGGAVFSTGSISFAGSLAHHGYDNDIARITSNVVQRFLDPEPFTMPT